MSRYRSVELEDWSNNDIRYMDGDLIIYDASVDGQGGTIRNKPVFTADEAAEYLNRGDDGPGTGTGAAWAGHKGGVNADYFPAPTVNPQASLETINFGFFETRADVDPAHFLIQGNAPGVSRADGFSTFTVAQREAARQALQSWDDVIDLRFVETSSAQADINFMNTTTGPAQASAFLPYDYGPDFGRLAGDVAVNPLQPSNAQFDEGEYGLTTLIHELGHSMGLEHPGSYNFGPGFAVTYDNGAEYYQDSYQYSIMSYWYGEETGAQFVDWEFLTYRYNSTPAVHDILAMQRIYGADMTTRTGDTVYGFNSNTGLDTFDFNLTPKPVVSIWDAGGNDTLDLSGFDTPSLINLNAGQHSSAGGILLAGYPTLEEINVRRAAAGLAPRTQAAYNQYVTLFGASFTDGLMRDNISIAYGTTIENAVGGGGDDTIIVNTAANVITGGAGSDTVSYETATQGVAVSLSLNKGYNGANGDSYISIENVTGGDFNDALSGNDEANELAGGKGNDTLLAAGGDDTLAGGDGNDQLNGGDGNDTIGGGEGNDNLFGANGNDDLDGGGGNDVLYGDAGNDRIDGGAGNDTLYGGAGADTFAFSDLGGTDRIVDFRRGQGDKIDLSGIDPDQSVDAVNEAFTYIGAAAFSGDAGELRVYKENGSTIISGDTNGDGVGDFFINAGNVNINQDDLILQYAVA